MSERTSLLEAELEKENGMAHTTAPGHSSRRALRILLAVIGLALIGTVLVYVRGRRAPSQPAPAVHPASDPTAQPVEVTTAPAIARLSSHSVEVVGSLAADEEVLVSAQVAGELASINVDFGSFVKQGQPIAQIDRRDAQMKLEQARASLNQTMARLGMKEGERYDPLQNADVRVAKSQLDWARMDLERSTKFYQGVFGLSVLSEDKEHAIVRLGHKRAIVSLRKERPYGTVDHFGIAIEHFNKPAVTEVLKQHGLTPMENWQYGFYFKDPDGVNVQIV